MFFKDFFDMLVEISTILWLKIPENDTFIKHTDKCKYVATYLHDIKVGLSPSKLLFQGL